VLDFTFSGLVIDRRPKILVLFEIPAYKKTKMVDFLVDSGSIFSAITEREASIMGIDCDFLPYSKREAVGFGGLFKTKMINRPVNLTFKSNKAEHTIKCSSFIVICSPPNISKEDREKLLRYTPNVLGMDILRRFKTTIDKNKVELTLV